MSDDFYIKFYEAWGFIEALTPEEQEVLKALCGHMVRLRLALNAALKPL